MNRHPPQTPGHRLDAEERALAALLPRPHGRSEPGADLDARILAAARAATEPAAAKSTPPRGRRWIAPTALAASLTLAVGLAWQLRPPPAQDASASTAASAADAESDAMTVRSFEVSPAPVAMEPANAESLKSVPMPPPAEPRPLTRAAEAPARVPASAAAEIAAAVAPPPAPPAPVMMDTPVAVPIPAPQMASPPAATGGVAPALANPVRTGEAARERVSATGNAATQPRAKSMAADAATLGSITVADPEQADEEVPPATADSPEVREAWLRRIGELLKQDKVEEAKASLTEFRRRYPHAIVPPELRKLEH